MNGLDLGVIIGVSALLVLVIVIMPFAARHDRGMARRQCADDGSAGAMAAITFGGDGGGSCSSDGGGGSC